jgi:hypothetical protein
VHQATQVGAQPGHSLELEHVRELVDHDPTEERLPLHAEDLHRAVQVGRDEQQSRRRLVLDQGQLVLAEDPLGHVAQHEAGLRGQRRPGAHPQRAGERPGGAEAVIETGGDGVEQVGERLEVRLGPLAPPHELGVRHRLGQLQPGVVRHLRLVLRHQRRNLGAQLHRRVRARREAGDLTGERPVDPHERRLAP